MDYTHMVLVQLRKRTMVLYFKISEYLVEE